MTKKFSHKMTIKEAHERLADGYGWRIGGYPIELANRLASEAEMYPENFPVEVTWEETVLGSGPDYKTYNTLSVINPLSEKPIAEYSFTH